MIRENAASRPRSWSEHEDLIAFFSSSRNRPEDLYPSERRFLPWLADQANQVLDVGCAAGGFSNVWRHYRSDVDYTGIDVSSELIATARAAHPSHTFLVGDCAEGLPFADEGFAIVQALGWLHWEPRYEAALRELWRLAARYCFIDVRLRETGRPTIRGQQRVAYTKEWDGLTVTPYIAVEWMEFARLLASLRPRRIYSHGYWGSPANTVTGVDARVCFSTFVLEKTSPEDNGCVVCIDSPLEWPVEIGSAAYTVLPASALSSICAPGPSDPR